MSNVLALWMVLASRFDWLREVCDLKYTPYSKMAPILE